MAERLVEDIFAALNEQTATVPGTDAAALIVRSLARSAPSTACRAPSVRESAELSVRPRGAAARTAASSGPPTVRRRTPQRPAPGKEVELLRRPRRTLPTATPHKAAG
ncbi:hypothetical protein [Streptomyces atratus]|uniref:hypothetical protein n=1 Tax=Streptomyces atratus TaxID=1893 RepID=UPI0026BA3770